MRLNIYLFSLVVTVGGCLALVGGSTLFLDNADLFLRGGLLSLSGGVLAVLLLLVELVVRGAVRDELARERADGSQR